MNAILACFEVLVVLTLKLAKMAFIGQKLTIIRKQHKYISLFVHGFAVNKHFEPGKPVVFLR